MEEKRERYIIAGGNEVCRTPPFKYVSEEMVNQIESHPEFLEQTKMYVITSKAYVEGDLIKILPAKEKSSRTVAKRFCEERKYCRFTKIIKTDGYVEKYWMEDYYLEKIVKANRRKMSKVKKKKNRDIIFYNHESILTERISSKLPGWLDDLTKNKDFDLYLQGDIKIEGCHKNIVVLKGSEVRNSPASYRYYHVKKYDTQRFPYKGTVGIIRLKKEMADSKKLFLFAESRRSKNLSITQSKVFNYFRCSNYFEDKKNGEIILVISQKSDLTKASKGVPMFVYLNLIKKHLTIPFQVSRDMKEKNWTPHVKTYHEF